MIISSHRPDTLLDPCTYPTFNFTATQLKQSVVPILNIDKAKVKGLSLGKRQSWLWNPSQSVLKVAHSSVGQAAYSKMESHPERARETGNPETRIYLEPSQTMQYSLTYQP